MNDPHVEELLYRIETGDGLTFQDPPPLVAATDAFRMTLADGVATFSMKEHHPAEQSAKQAVESFLRAWELDGALQHDSSQLRFVFDRSLVIDREPPPPPPPGKPQTVQLAFLEGSLDSPLLGAVG